MITGACRTPSLGERYGCVPRNPWIDLAKYPSSSSVYTWLGKEVVPDIAIREDRAGKQRLGIINRGIVRFDIHMGPFNRDSIFTIFPFSSTWKFIPDVLYAAAKEVLYIIDGKSKATSVFEPGSTLELRWLAGLERRTLSEEDSCPGVLPGVNSNSVDNQAGQKPLDDNGLPEEPVPAVGYVTKDHLHNESGDDTPHTPYLQCSVPPHFQSKVQFPEHGDPESIDLAFIDFMETRILRALRDSPNR